MALHVSGETATCRRKRNRLDLDVYRGSAAYFVTATVRQRRQAFTAHEIVEPCVSMLRTCAEQNRTEVVAYCFMPDHVHLLLAVREEANLTGLMRIFKQRTGYRCKKLLEWDGPFWQKSY